MEKQKLKNARGQAVKPPPAAKTPPPAPIRVPPLFRKIDWLALVITFAVIWIVYFLTLAPEQTLEDSGELCTGSFYAGIPHPPGYPFWAIYSWLWTKLLVVGNVAWRVEVGEATAAALACGLVAFMVSRGSSMLMEGIEELRNMTGKWENVICMVSGIVAGLLLGLGGVMWSESVVINRISPFGAPWMMIVLLCLLRWIYAPHQRRYLYCAMFFFGICLTIHQTLLCAAMGIEFVIVFVQPRLGRNLLIWNSIVYLAGLAAQNAHLINMLDTAQMVLVIYHTVGILSIAAFVWLSFQSKEDVIKPFRDIVMALLAAAVFGLLLASMKVPILFFPFLAALGALVWLALKTKKWGWEWLVVIVLGVLWLAGASFFFYEPIAGMTDPPMQWGYPRTVEGFFHALSRGQYEKASPSDVIHDPGHFIVQLGILVSDIATEFNWVLVFVALVPLLFFFKMQKRERSWIAGLVAIYLCVGVLLMVLMNTSSDRQSAELNKVFFITSHGLIAIMIGYGLALTAAYMATHFVRIRVVGILLGVVTIVPALITLYDGVCHTFYGDAGLLSYLFILLLFFCLAAAFVLAALAGQCLVKIRDTSVLPQESDRSYFLALIIAAAVFLGTAIIMVFFRNDSLSFAQFCAALGRVFAPNQYSLPVVAGLLIVGIAVTFLGSLLIYRQRAPLAITLGLFAIMPLASGLSHWAHSEQRNHWFGYWFGHDMFTPPFVAPDGQFSYDAKLREQAMKGPYGDLVYPEMTKDTVLFGGTDPGRFCPTYAIFCDSFIPHDCQPVQDQNFDRRDVYLITQNALADGTYLDYLRAQYFRSQQIDPPFFSELARTLLKDQPYETNLLARIVSPLDWIFEARGAHIENRWRVSTSRFTGKDFTSLPALAAKLRPSDKQDPLSQWLFQNLGQPTQDLITGKGNESRLRTALATDLNQLLETDTIYDTSRFAQVKLSDYLQQFLAQNPQGDTRIRLNRLLLEAAYPDEIAKSPGGVYPDREIYIPSPEDSQRCFQDYMEDVQHRMPLGQMMPGEDVHVDPSGRMQVSGQVAVMMINGLLCKVIFDHNPKNEFFIEESFPLPWMYPYETPFSIIMKINRKPLPELPDEVFKRDHAFWSKYSDRLIGNWITYDTSVSNIVDFIERVYLRHNYAGFKGDLKFVRDDQAQKAFSKLRSSQAGVYSWRLGPQCPDEYRQKTTAGTQALIRETDFACKQAFAFCPYSPEAVIRYVNFLLQYGRIDDALLVAQTCHKLDPYNDQGKTLVKQLEDIKNQSANRAQIETQVQHMENEARTNPGNLPNLLSLAGIYIQMQQTNRAIELFDRALANPHITSNEAGFIAQKFVELGNLTKLEGVLQKIVTLVPDQPEPWYDLAALEAVLGKPDPALQSLHKSLDLSAQRLKSNPTAHDLLNEARKDQHFDSLRNLPEFQKLVPPN
jgi:tetratricopeptide (TPR) repeat protein